MNTTGHYRLSASFQEELLARFVQYPDDYRRAMLATYPGIPSFVLDAVAAGQARLEYDPEADVLLVYSDL